MGQNRRNHLTTHCAARGGAGPGSSTFIKHHIHHQYNKQSSKPQGKGGETPKSVLGTNTAGLHSGYFPAWFMQSNHANQCKAALAVKTEQDPPDGRESITPFQCPAPQELPHALSRSSKAL